MKATWRRICAGLYEVGGVRVERRWHRGYCCEMWNVLVGEECVEMDGYLRDAKDTATALAKARGEA